VFLRVARLPTLPPPVVEPGFDENADALLHGEHVERLDFLRWLGRARGVVFHGSPRDDLVELSTERTSRDSGSLSSSRRRPSSPSSGSSTPRTSCRASRSSRWREST
jgi:hypothetical protein